MKNGRQVSRQVETVTNSSINHKSRARAPDISLRPRLSNLITKFTCQRGRKSTREWGRALSSMDNKNEKWIQKCRFRQIYMKLFGILARKYFWLNVMKRVFFQQSVNLQQKGPDNHRPLRDNCGLKPWNTWCRLPRLRCQQSRHVHKSPQLTYTVNYYHTKRDSMAQTVQLRPRLWKKTLQFRLNTHGAALRTSLGGKFVYEKAQTVFVRAQVDAMRHRKLTGAVVLPSLRKHTMTGRFPPKW